MVLIELIAMAFDVGRRVFEVLCGHFSSNHILQKLKYASEFTYGSS